MIRGRPAIPQNSKGQARKKTAKSDNFVRSNGKNQVKRGKREVGMTPGYLFPDPRDGAVAPRAMTILKAILPDGKPGSLNDQLSA